MVLGFRTLLMFITALFTHSLITKIAVKLTVPNTLYISTLQKVLGIVQDFVFRWSHLKQNFFLLNNVCCNRTFIYLREILATFLSWIHITTNHCIVDVNAYTICMSQYMYLCGLSPIYLSKTLKILTLILWSTKAKTTDNRQKKFDLTQGRITHIFVWLCNKVIPSNQDVHWDLHLSVCTKCKEVSYLSEERLDKYLHVPLQHKNVILSNNDILVQCTCIL